MLSALVAGVFTIVGVFIGFYVHLLLRKEKFKEIIYKEKLAIYKEFSKELSLVIVETTNWLNKGTKSEELTTHSDCFFVTLNSGWFIISDDLLKTGMDIFSILAKDQITEDAYGVFGEKVRKFVDLMREELQVKFIAVDIIDTLKFGKKIE